jgi:C4-dicarboxylate transporter
MEEILQEDSLDARLRDEAPYLDDAGFTSRVVHKLPARHVRRSYRALILIGITLTACLVAFYLSGATGLFVEGVTFVTMMPVTMIWLWVGAAGVLIMAGSLAAAYSRTRGRSR